MTGVQWTIAGPEFVNCNCAYGCPCRFNGLPTQVFATPSPPCTSIMATGATTLDGSGLLASSASPRGSFSAKARRPSWSTSASNQRNWLLRILSELDTEPGATIFNVFASTLGKLHDPILAPIQYAPQGNFVIGPYVVMLPECRCCLQPRRRTARRGNRVVVARRS